MDSIEPFGIPGGGIFAPPVNVPEHGVAVAWDSINGGLAGISTAGSLEPLWHLDIKPTMQPVVFPDSGELVINDFTDDQSGDYRNRRQRRKHNELLIQNTKPQ